MLSELVDEHSNSIVEQLDDSVMEGDQNPWADWVKAQPFDTFALSFELVDEHL